MNHTTQRFPRTSQREPWANVITRYRRPLAERVANAIKTGAVLALFAAIGLMLGWRG